MPPRSIKGNITIDILRKFPDAPHRQLAKILIRDNPILFNDEENARSCLRYYAGAIGNFNRKYATTKDMFRDKEKGKMLRTNPFGLPKSQMDNWKPMRFPITKGRGMMLYDTHIPYQDNQAITISLQWGIDNQYTDFIYLGGDIADCYQLSRFERDPRKRKFKQDLDDCKKFLDALRKAYPKAIIIWKDGNHERWLDRYLKIKAPELLDLDEWIWDNYLGLKERGIIHVEEDIPLYVGKLSVLHGHELQGTQTTVNPARGAYLKAMECVILGHFHRTSQHAEMSLSRRLDTAWSVGALCCLWPEYSRLNKWNSGFAALEVDGSDFEVENKRIVKGTVR